MPQGGNRVCATVYRRSDGPLLACDWRTVQGKRFFQKHPTLRKVALGLSAFVTLGTQAHIFGSVALSAEIKAYLGAPMDCVCVAMHAAEKAAPKPTPAGDLRV